MFGGLDRDDMYWYGGAGWLRLRRMVRALSAREFERYLDHLERVHTDEALSLNVWKVFLHQLIAAIDDLRMMGMSDAQYILPLLADVDQISMRLARDPVLQLMSQPQARLDDNSVDAFAAFWHLLRQYLEQERRKLFGVNANRRKVWERLERISKVVARDIAQLENRMLRCTDPHFLGLMRDKIIADYPKDKNLPRTTRMIENYFLEFSSEFSQRDDIALDDLRPEDLPVFIQELGIQIDIERYIVQLKNIAPELHEVICIKYGFVMPGLSFGSIVEYCEARKISLRTFQRRVLAAQSRLRDALEADIGVGDRFSQEGQ